MEGILRILRESFAVYVNIFEVECPDPCHPDFFHHRLECVTAASALHPCIEQFKTMSIELLGDTGAAHDIGSLEALQEQGAPVDTVKPWIRCQDSPIIDLPSHEALELYARSVGELQLHLLKRCPLAMSIGKQVSSGRTFIGDTGENRIWSQITESVRYGFP